MTYYNPSTRLGSILKGIVSYPIFIWTLLPVVHCMMPAFVVFGHHYLALREWKVWFIMSPFLSNWSWRISALRLTPLKTTTQITKSSSQGFSDGSLKVKCTSHLSPSVGIFPTCAEYRQHWETWTKHGGDNPTTKQIRSRVEWKSCDLIFNVSVYLAWKALSVECKVGFSAVKLPILLYEKLIYCYNLNFFMPHFFQPT